LTRQLSAFALEERRTGALLPRIGATRVALTAPLAPTALPLTFALVTF
jgi:hypothetical protein